VILLQVLIGHSGEKRCKKMKNAKGCFGKKAQLPDGRTYYGMELYGRFCLLWKMEDLHLP